MKKILLIGASAMLPLLFSTTAFATPVCAGDTTAQTKQVTKGSDFIVNDFDMKCSANVHLSYEENATAVGVGAASVKGKNIFAGSSSGGAVAPTGKCAGTACTAAEAASAATTALGSS